MEQNEPIQTEPTEEFYPGFYWKFLALAIAGNIINHFEARLKFPLITFAIFTSLSLYLCVAAVNNSRAKQFSTAGLNLLCLAGAICLIISCFSSVVLGFSASWWSVTGYACFIGVGLIQYVSWKRSVNKVPSAV